MKLTQLAHTIKVTFITADANAESVLRMLERDNKLERELDNELDDELDDELDYKLA